MSEGRYDSLVDVAAGAVMAGAIGYCLFTGWTPGQIDVAGGGALLAFAGTFGAMRKMPPARMTDEAAHAEHVVPEALDFAPADDSDVDVLEESPKDAATQFVAEDAPLAWLETEAAPIDTAEEGDLVLDDIVAQLEPQSRVVRLFAPEQHEDDPAALRARVDRHLAGEAAVEEERQLLASKPAYADEDVAATNRLAAALDRVRQRLD